MTKLFRVTITSTAKKNLKKLSTKKQTAFFEKVELLHQEPYRGKKLAGSLKDYYSLRLWPYRIIYTVDKTSKTVTIHAIEHRQDVY